jgi:phosphoglycerate dehydrogenase-like enzyme
MPKLEAEFLDATPRLKALFYATGSVKGFAAPESYKRGILLSSSWQANAIPVAEYSNATILLGLKGFWSSQRLARGEIARMGYWMKDELDLYLAHKPLQHRVTKDMLARMA